MKNNLSPEKKTWNAPFLIIINTTEINGGTHVGGLEWHFYPVPGHPSQSTAGSATHS